MMDKSHNVLARLFVVPDVTGEGRVESSALVGELVGFGISKDQKLGVGIHVIMESLVGFDLGNVHDSFGKMQTMPGHHGFPETRERI